MTLTLTLLLLSQVQVNIPLPPIVFPAPPPLVVIEPGVQVVEDNDDEVFFVDNFYWVQRDGRWFKSRDHKGSWVVVDGPLVPPLIVKQPKGKWKKYKKGFAAGVRAAEKHDDDDDDHGRGKGKGKGGKGKGKGRD